MTSSEELPKLLSTACDYEAPFLKAADVSSSLSITLVFGVVPGLY